MKTILDDDAILQIAREFDPAYLQNKRETYVMSAPRLIAFVRTIELIVLNDVLSEAREVKNG